MILIVLERKVTYILQAKAVTFINLLTKTSVTRFTFRPSVRIVLGFLTMTLYPLSMIIINYNQDMFSENVLKLKIRVEHSMDLRSLLKTAVSGHLMS